MWKHWWRGSCSVRDNRHRKSLQPKWHFSTPTCAKNWQLLKLYLRTYVSLRHTLPQDGSAWRLWNNTHKKEVPPNCLREYETKHTPTYRKWQCNTRDILINETVCHTGFECVSVCQFKVKCNSRGKLKRIQEFSWAFCVSIQPNTSTHKLTELLLNIP